MTNAENDTPPRRRSQRAQARILAAAWELFAERGLRTMSIEAVSAKAGVGKTTIYRWWPSKAAVVLDALHQHMDADIGFPDTGSVRTDLTRQLRAVIRLLKSPPGQAYLALVAESQQDSSLATELRERYITQRRAAATTAIIRGIQRGELTPDTNPDVLIDAIYGAVYYRLLVAHAAPPDRYAREVVELVLHGWVTRP